MLRIYKIDININDLFIFRFVEYKPTSLERSYKYDLLTEHDLGVTIDLINPDTYRIEPGGLYCTIQVILVLYLSSFHMTSQYPYFHCCN